MGNRDAMVIAPTSSVTMNHICSARWHTFCKDYAIGPQVPNNMYYPTLSMVPQLVYNTNNREDAFGNLQCVVTI